MPFLQKQQFAWLIWIGDPCYCVTPDGDSHPAENWDEFCAALQEDDNEYFHNWGMGISVRTGHGDGCYPVYVKRDDCGNIAEVKIVFIHEER